MSHIISRPGIKKITVVLFVLIVLFFSSQRFFKVASSHLNCPYDLGLESHCLASIESIRAGEAVYERDFFESPPFIFTMYNPLYFSLAALFPAGSANPFFAGRLISLVTTVLIFFLFFLPGYTNRNRKVWYFSFLSAGWVLFIPVFMESTVYLNPDMMAVLFSCLSIVTIERHDNKFALVLSSLFGLLAFAAKQSFVGATAAAFIFLCFRNRRDAFFFGMTTVIFYGLFFILAITLLGSGYWFSTIISVMKSPSFFHLIMERMIELLRQPMFDLLLISVTLSIVFVSIKHREAFGDSPYPIYLELTFLLPFISSGKVGGEASYYIEFFTASLLWLNYFTKRFYLEIGNRHVIIFLLSFLFFLGIELKYSETSTYLLTSHPSNFYFKNNIPERMRKEITGLKPENNRFVVLNTHVMYRFLEKGYLNDPYHYWLLWNHKILDPEPMIKAIREKYFAVIMFAGKNNLRFLPAMYPIPSGSAKNRIVRALRKNYRVQKEGVFTYFTPIR